ncbi:MAG TPA: hypothetical protein VNA69_02065 [Thermoanaerobaculia bacterium]|nr:hypothetical protein [Thermoanaerobaculia bacterium]
MTAGRMPALLAARAVDLLLHELEIAIDKHLIVRVLETDQERRFPIGRSAD